MVGIVFVSVFVILCSPFFVKFLGFFILLQDTKLYFMSHFWKLKHSLDSHGVWLTEMLGHPVPFCQFLLCLGGHVCKYISFQLCSLMMVNRMWWANPAKHFQCTFGFATWSDKAPVNLPLSCPPLSPLSSLFSCPPWFTIFCTLDRPFAGPLFHGHLLSSSSCQPVSESMVQLSF